MAEISIESKRPAQPGFFERLILPPARLNKEDEIIKGFTLEGKEKEKEKEQLINWVNNSKFWLWEGRLGAILFGVLDTTLISMHFGYGQKASPSDVGLYFIGLLSAVFLYFVVKGVVGYCCKLQGIADLTESLQQKNWGEDEINKVIDGTFGNDATIRSTR